MWGLGYVSSDWEEDNDEGDYEEDEEEAGEAARLEKAIFAEKELDEADMEIISESTHLRDVYNCRWWKPTLDNCYFAMYNMSTKPIQKGDQLIFSYGGRNNTYLLSNYGFSLPND